VTTSDIVSARDLDRLLAYRRFSAGLAFTADGSGIVFSGNRSGQFNLWHVDLDGNERRLTSFTDDTVRSAAVSPDGTIAFSADHDGDEFHQLYLLRVGEEAPERLTDAPQVQHLLGPGAFSPDGTRLAYAANARTQTDMEVWIRELGSGESRPLFGEGTYAVPGAWSPDGRKLLVNQLRNPADVLAFVVDVETGEAVPFGTPDEDVIELTGPWTPDGSAFYLLSDREREFRGIARCDASTGSRMWIETPDHDIEELSVSADGSTLAWLVNEDGVDRVTIRRDERTLTAGLPAGSRPHLAGLHPPLAVSQDGSRVAIVLSTPQRPPDIWLVTTADGSAEALTTAWNGTRIAEDDLAVAELVTYPTFDGRDIPAWLYRPARAGRVPVVLAIHGGPQAQERPVYNPLYQYLVGRGIAVLATNIRGSTGYGKTYQRLIERDWGGGDLRDWEHAVGWLRGQDWVDGERLGVYGGSYGGFAVLTCVTRLPEHWAAAVDVFGPSNLITLTRTVPPTWRRMMKRWLGDPDEDAEFLRERSPLTYIENVKTPLLVIQGAKDYRVAKAESDQFVDRLRELGRTIEYVVYEDEGHGFTKRENEIAMWRAAAAWLERHLAPSA
jgi:Tol biopolymer transport system component/dienelactone hydrolase